MSAEVVCRGCGALGYEEPDDPCPGLCPACFEAGLVADMRRSWRERWDEGVPLREVMRRSLGRLEALGMTPQALAHTQRRKEADLAEELAQARGGGKWAPR